MTSPTDPTNDPFEEQLRQLLKAEADTVTTSPEALNLIRERTERNRGSIWFGLPWLRPALAVAGATLIAASVIMSSPQVRDHVLEIVPAGADREGTLTERGQSEDVAVPDPSTGSVDGTTQPEPVPPEKPAASPSPEVEEEGSAPEEDPKTASTCPEPVEGPSPSPTATSGEDGEAGAAEKEGCEPVEKPSPGTGGDEGTGEGEGDSATGEDGTGTGGGGEDTGSGEGGGDTGTGGGGEDTGGTVGTGTADGDTTSKTASGS
ncbi:putative membrane protein YgcG [Nocardiopsis arvandica]|uniref:Putative membrane protein YgcG n=1 Tax=Nocardiopsis sinuspersici TaxID=501010 RepID=A0A7Z0BM34_9ACTN|nr:hypothetical protein [Nocardiopsis sinuspersici]NYH54167.1 putative membrane protein YgcG [Nocardiopsis sinuspersici]